MALEERTRPYETLIRHNADGTIGAHHQTITEILRDGIVISAVVSDPKTIGGSDLSSVLGEATTAALAENETLKSRVAALQSQVADLQLQIEQLQKLAAPTDEAA
ncbi:hypothetical protein AH2_00045 [Burkholderia phage vB_BceS_AH2]|uniref:Uncharacterized protein n=1 Tax=Burkholderia phage vB_BceS_AH2 TaxID=1133022 RepID=I6NTM7_9CAUD|nr:hypothetical protein B613_gp47 [Burkholderia phage vB_BceS_AH2]AEY69554.1 hypothetical protein AH2_00045 [Burkholderia phage vB_BceS_AH2]